MAMSTTTASRAGPDRFLTVPELVERWPIGRNSTYTLLKSPNFPPARVLLRQANGQARSMGYRESDIVAFEIARRVHASELDLDTPTCLPPAKRPAPPEGALMPAKGYTGITRRPPLRSDRGVKLYAPTIAKPCFRFVAAGQVEHERTGAPRAPRRELEVFFVAS